MFAYTNEDVKHEVVKHIMINHCIRVNTVNFLRINAKDLLHLSLEEAIKVTRVYLSTYSKLYWLKASDHFYGCLGPPYPQ